MLRGADSPRTRQEPTPNRWTAKRAFAVALCSLLLLAYHWLAEHPSTSHATAPDMANVPHPNGRVSVGYFTNWGIYARGYKPEAVPVQDLTHLLYGPSAPSPRLLVSQPDE